VFTNIKNFFITGSDKEFSFYRTSIFSDEIFDIFNKVVDNFIENLKDNESPEYILKKFLNDNNKIGLKTIQIYSSEGKPTISLTQENLNHINSLKIKNTFNSLVRQLSKTNNENTNYSIINTTDYIFIIVFYLSEKSALFGVSKKESSDKNITNLQIIDKILRFSTYFESRAL